MGHWPTQSVHKLSRASLHYYGNGAPPPLWSPRVRQNNNNISVEIGRRTGRLTLLVEVFWLPGLGPQEVDKGGRVEADLQKVDKLDKPVDKVEDYGRPR